MTTKAKRNSGRVCECVYVDDVICTFDYWDDWNDWRDGSRFPIGQSWKHNTKKRKQYLK